MMKRLRLCAFALALGLRASAWGGDESSQLAKGEVETSRDIVSIEPTYTFSSDFKDSRFGHGDSFHNDFSYDHRFQISGKWFFRAGLEYERYDFDGTENGIPDHLQAAYGKLAVEYVVNDFPGIMLEVDPGEYFQNQMSGDAFDFPIKGYVAFPLVKDKIYGIVGGAGGLFQDPSVAPGGGVIWIFNDTLKLLGVFPRPALIWQPNDDWQFKLLGELYYNSFRTDDVVTPAGNFHLHHALVQYSEDRAGVAVTYGGFKPFKISAEGGCTFLRDFDFYRSNQSVKADPAGYLRVAIEARF